MTDMIEQEKGKNVEHDNCESESQGGEGGSDGPKEGRKPDGSGSSVQEDTKKATEGNDQGNVAGQITEVVAVDDLRTRVINENTEGNTEGGP